MTQTKTSPASTSLPAIPVDVDAAAAVTPAMLQERRRIIEDIRAHNPTAHHAFLAEFSTEALRDYLEHLRHARQKHIRLPGWLERRTAALANARRQVRKVA